MDLSDWIDRLSDVQVMGYWKDEGHQLLSPGMPLYSRCCPEEQRVGGTRSVLALHMPAILDSSDPSCALIGSSSRVMRKGCMQLAAFHLQNTMHFPLRAFRRVASVLWTLVANQTSSQAKHHYTGGPRQACIGVVSTAISSPLTSVLVPVCTRLSLVVYRVHFMQAARRRPIQATKPDFNDFMTMNTHQEIVPCSQTQS
jgi:hypothetical protein